MWDAKKTVVFFLPIVLLLAAALVLFLLRKTIRMRLRMKQQLTDDPDIHDYLVVFNWSRKVLYVPTIIVSVLACVAMLLKEWGLLSALPSGLVGGIWFGVFFINFLVDEYEISVKVLIIWTLCVVAVFLWLSQLGWVVSFLRFFRNLGVEIDSTGYLVLAIAFSLAIAISWVKGLFYYVAITPNYMNIQIGPTETGEQISREEYSTRVDTGDFLERLFGFGKIIITFSDQRRQPIVLLVSKIGRTAAKLEAIRGKLAVDRPQPLPTNGSDI